MKCLFKLQKHKEVLKVNLSAICGFDLFLLFFNHIPGSFKLRLSSWNAISQARVLSFNC